MTVTSTTSRNNYNGAGSTGPYAYNFRVYSASELLVTRQDADGVEDTLVYPTDFSVTGVNGRTGGTITLMAALAVGEVLTIRRVLPLTQLINLRNQGATFPSNVEDGLDQSVMREQQLDNDIQSSVRLAETVDPAVFDPTLPANLAPGDAIVVNAAGTGFSQAALTAAQLSAWSATHNETVDVFLNPGAVSSLTLSADPGNVNNVTVTLRVGGVDKLLMRDEYSVAGTTISFTSPLPSPTRVEVAYLYTYQVNRVVGSNIVGAIPAGHVDATVVSYTPTATGAIARTVQQKLDDVFNVKDFGAVGDGSTDDTVALQAAIDVAKTNGGTVFFPRGIYLVTAPLDVTLTFPGACQGTAFMGEGSPTSDGVSTNLSNIYAAHTGHVFDCSGRRDMFWQNLGIWGDASTTPQTGWFLARNAVGSGCGKHRFINCRSEGSFTKAVLYNYGSEENTYLACWFKNDYTGADAVTITAYNIQSLASSFMTIATGAQSTIINIFNGGSFQASGANSHCVQLEAVVAQIADTWMLASSGHSLVYLNMTNAAAGAVLSGITGENAGASTQLYGVYAGGGTATTVGCTVRDCGFSALTNAFYGADNITFDALHIEQMFGSPGAGVSVWKMQSSYWKSTNTAIAVRSLSTRNIFIGNSVNWTIAADAHSIQIDTGSATDATFISALYAESLILPSIGGHPGTPATGQIVFTGTHWEGWDGAVWKQLDN